MEWKTNYANRNNYGGWRGVPKYLVYHFTANDGDTDEGNGKYFHNNVPYASSHYFVDDDSCTLTVPEQYVAYAVGGRKYPNTKGGSFYGICTNNNSIHIEMCDTEKNGYYNFTEATLSNAIELGKYLMKKYGIPIENAIRHYDVTGKICPKPFVDDEQAWKNFKARLTTADTGWKQNDYGWWYAYDENNNYYVNEWAEIDGYWYRFDSNGYALQNRWFQSDYGYWYYFDGSCHMATGWRYILGDWFYLTEVAGELPVGAMVDGLQKINGEWYFLNPISDGTRGVMKKGWQWIDGEWYYFNDKEEGCQQQMNGVMLRQHFLNYDGHKFYLKEDGKMAHDEEIVIGEDTYSFNEHGWLE